MDYYTSLALQTLDRRKRWLTLEEIAQDTLDYGDLLLPKQKEVPSMKTLQDGLASALYTDMLRAEGRAFAFEVNLDKFGLVGWTKPHMINDVEVGAPAVGEKRKVNAGAIPAGPSNGTTLSSASKRTKGFL